MAAHAAELGARVEGERERTRFKRDKRFNRDFCFLQISDSLLHQKANLESCYFAAQTLRTKIQVQNDIANFRNV